MGEIIVREHIDNCGLSDEVRVRSCGIGAWHVGQPADPRAQDELEHSGYDPTHTAAQLGPEHMDATLFIAMDHGHFSQLVARGIPAEKIRLLRSFDPQAPEGAIVEDPYYGGRDGFVVTREQIEAAAPGIEQWVRETLSLVSDR